ncbi:sulfotransferase family protein [Mucilaginibacter sp. L196]|uniref:sulfotransferase family protein n=1 Tax=Mucilaginibacter sp. L196 TaxID=1641870 RepID=UPI00131D63D1|nr:sulfotransferase family protein [Mucilaginibacter sp. L196]
MYSEDNELKCRWRYFKSIEFTDPFFNETILKASCLEINSRYYRPVSDLSILTEWVNAIHSVEPTVFIFHISRCGSTLLSQTLGLNDEHIILSEVPFIDDLLKLLTIDEWLINVEYQAILKAAIELYGRSDNTNKKRLFVKTDSWHLHYLPLFRLLYPSTLFLLLFRKPDEVLRSQQKKRGMHAVPGLISDSILGIQSNKINIANFDGHMIKVLESYYASLIKITQNDDLSFLANYDEGIEQIINRLASYINIDIDKNYRTLIHERCLYNAKFPDQVFKEEPSNKEVLPDLTKAFILYTELEKIRSLQIFKINSNIEA